MKQNPIKNLIREAILVSKELGEITFVGAVAVYLHTRKTRESQDIDFAVAAGVSKEVIRKGKYITYTENGKEVTRTPRSIKVDIYDTDVSDIPVETIADTAISIEADKKGTMLRVACLEALIIAKHRASRPSRPQDDQDLLALAQEKYEEIDWHLLKTMVKSDIEYDNIRTTMQTMHSLYRFG